MPRLNIGRSRGDEPKPERPPMCGPAIRSDHHAAGQRPLEFDCQTAWRIGPARGCSGTNCRNHQGCTGFSEKARLCRFLRGQRGGIRRRYPDRQRSNSGSGGKLHAGRDLRLYDGEGCGL